MNAQQLYDKALKYVEEGNLISFEHPELPLIGFKYSANAAFENKWDEVTTVCRGIVFDKNTKEVIARGFNKFFNLGEPNCPISDLKEDSYRREYIEKVDGSCILMYWYDGYIRTSTLGSFVSEQAIRARELLFEKYKIQSYAYLPEDTFDTEIFEYVSPENRIVVNYGDDEQLFYLGGHCELNSFEVNPYICQELSQEYLGMGMRLPKTSGNPDFDFKSEVPNSEGYVIRCHSNNLSSDGVEYVKYKFPTYVKAHALLSNLVPMRVIRLMESGDYDSVYKSLPPEWSEQLDDIYSLLTTEKEAIQNQISDMWKEIKSKNPQTDKDHALLIKEYPKEDQAFLFSMLRGFGMDNLIFKRLKEWYKC